MLTQKNRIKKILILRLDRIGDIVLSTPAIEAVRKGFPEASIAVMVKEGYKDLLINDPAINEVIGCKPLWDLKFIRELRDRKFDLAVDLVMDRDYKSAFLAYLSRAPYRAGYDIAGRGIFFNIKAGQGKEKKHLVENNLDVIRKLGIVPGGGRPKLHVAPQDSGFIRDFLSLQGIDQGEILVGIHPGGYYPSQRWPAERVASLSDEIIKRYPAKVVLIGGPKERDFIERAAGSMKVKAIVVKDISLAHLTALIRRCQLLVCNNSGPLHIACALGVPTVSTMGPTLPWRWWPVGEGHIVLRKDLPCSPCGKGSCGTHECMELITVDEMLEAVDRQMKLLVKNKCAESTAR